MNAGEQGAGRHLESPHELFQLAEELFPLPRALMGDGVRRTLARIGQEIPLTQIEVPSGTSILDWTIPQEWRIDRASIRRADGTTLVDYRDSHLHVMSYSHAVHQTATWSELLPYLYTDPDHPDAIPYRTGHFRNSWGFCLPHRVWQAESAAPAERYEVDIASELFPGSLTLGECILPGENDSEFLFYAHTCHPCLANDNVSGLVVATALARHLLSLPRRQHTYRFVFGPATLGPIVWMSLRQAELPRIRGGLVLTLLGDRQPLSYKRSEREDAEIDQVIAELIQSRGTPDRIHRFVPWGYDERQFNSPGCRLPVGCLMRSLPGGYAGYHNSGDDLAGIEGAALADSLAACQEIVGRLEANRYYRNGHPWGEPQLGPSGLYRAFAERDDRGALQAAILWVLNQSDGTRSLNDIARRAQLPCDLLLRAAELLESHHLIERIDQRASGT